MKCLPWKRKANILSQPVCVLAFPCKFPCKFPCNVDWKLLCAIVLAKAQTVYCVLNSVVGSTVLPYCCHEEQCDYRCIGLATILTNQCTLSIISRFLYKCIESDYISFTKKMSICLALFSSVYLSKKLMLARYIISKTSSALISFLLSDTCMNLFCLSQLSSLFSFNTFPR